MNTLRWFDAVRHYQQTGEAYALITVIGCSGSTPRDQSSKMVVTGDATHDSIGGGNLEFVVCNKAREILADNLTTQQIHPFPLGGALGQCCGGSVTVMIETFAACRFHVGVFGAGHVANELVKILGGLPCRVIWVDSRAEMFPESLPLNVQKVLSSEPQRELAELPPGADALILTHNHQLDFELCVAALHHPNLRHIGLIGSNTKAERFSKRLLHKGFNKEQVDRICCPVGLRAVPGKLPMEVAVSIAGELIALENQNKPNNVQRGLPWKAIKKHFRATGATPAITKSTKTKSAETKSAETKSTKTKNKDSQNNSDADLSDADLTTQPQAITDPDNDKSGK